jgi:hypothetical protein
MITAGFTATAGRQARLDARSRRGKRRSGRRITAGEAGCRGRPKCFKLFHQKMRGK